MNTPKSHLDSQLDRELERERNEHLHNDDERSRWNPAEDFRMKDARENTSSTNLHRSRPR